MYSQNPETILKYHIEMWQTALDLIPHIKKAIAEYDGKQVNKRFADVLETVSDDINARVGKFHSWADKNSLQVHVKHKNLGYNEHFNLIWVYDIDEVTTGNKRLEAAKLLEMLDIKAVELRKIIADAKVGLSQIDLYKAEIEKLKGYASYINHLIPDPVRRFYQLNIRVELW